MFDIGFLELLLIGVLALLVLGPERLPGAIRTATYWISKIRRSFQQVKLELEREVDIAELKQQIHNDAIMEELAKAKGDIDENIEQTRANLQKQLGDSSTYQLDDAFDKPASSKPSSSKPATDKINEYVPHEDDVMPDHPPLPDPEEEAEKAAQDEPDASPSRPASDRS